jgi:ABC-type branched-subunit amino acid transport system permease subunit
VLYALLLILFMIFRPQGLLGRREFGWRWLRREPRPR